MILVPDWLYSFIISGKAASPTCDKCGSCDNSVCEVKESPEIVVEEVKQEDPGKHEEVLPPKLKDISSENWNSLAPSVASEVVSEEGKEEEAGCFDKMLSEVDDFLERDPSGEEGERVQQPAEGGIVDDEVQETAPEVEEEKAPETAPTSTDAVIEFVSATIVEEDNSADMIMDPDTEAVLRVTLHSVHDITRTMDLTSDVDPYVELSANNVVLGKTHVAANAVTADFEESFFIKTSQDPKSIKLRFTLKDKDVMSDDDFVGFGYFDMAEEYNTTNQKVHMKWKGEEVGYLLITVDTRQVVIV